MPYAQECSTSFPSAPYGAPGGLPAPSPPTPGSFVQPGYAASSPPPPSFSDWQQEQQLNTPRAAGDVLRTKRSLVAAALCFRAPHHAEISVDVDSLSVTRSSMNDMSVRIMEGEVFSGASSSQAPRTPSPLPVPTPTNEPPPPTRPPSPVLSPTFEQREPAELEGVVVMDEDAATGRS